MLTLIHGADMAASRKFFLEQKKQVGLNVASLSGENVNLTDLMQILEGGELFATEKNLFIEQFLTKKKKSKERDTITDVLNKQSIEHTIVLWEDKELDRTTLNAFKKAIIKDFKLPQTLFALLDSLKPDNSKQMITLFHKTIETSELEMIFFMLIRQFRLLLALSTFSPSPNQDNPPIDEVKRLAPWQKTKLENQARLFGAPELIALYTKLFQIELAQKTGTLTAPLVSTIDFFLLEI